MSFLFRRHCAAAWLIIVMFAPAALLAQNQESTGESDTGATSEQSTAEAGAGVAAVDSAEANEADVLSFGPGEPGAEALIGTGHTYSHDWSDRRGQWILNLNWGVVQNNSRVFASAGECRPGGGKFIGAARYTVHNVAQTNGTVSVWVDINYSSPIRLCVDYLVINP